MKIALFGHKTIPSRIGGIEIVVEQLSSRMVKLGNDVTCFNRESRPFCSAQKSFNGIRIKNVFSINKKGFSAVSSSFIASVLTAFGNFDVVHIHAEGPAFMCWLPKLFGKKVVVTVHGLDHQREKWGKFASSFIMLGERNAARYADEIIVLSLAVKEYFRKKYNRETVYIPNGVSKPKIKKANEITEKWGLNKNSYILFVGRIVPEKGIRYLLEAWSEIKSTKKLVIVGGSSDTDDFYKEITNNHIDNVICTGFVQGELLEELFSNAYIYVLPSDLEGMPLSLLEAMSYENCCLTSDINECTEVIEDKGVSFKKGNVQDLKNKLEMLLNNEELVNKYKKESSEYICNKYNWDDVVERTLELYKR